MSCPNDEQEKPNSFCENCPVKQAENDFKEFSVNALEENSNCKGWQKIGFNELRRQVRQVGSMEEMPKSSRTLKLNALINEFIGARNYQERIERQNSKKSD